MWVTETADISEIQMDLTWNKTYQELYDKVNALIKKDASMKFDKKEPPIFRWIH